MNAIQNWDFRGHDIRTMTASDGETLFLGKDIAARAGHKDTDYAIRAYCKRAQTYPGKISGQVRHPKWIPESDVYRLLAHSHRPEAVEFERWIFEEVLPTIRRTGRYEMAGERAAVTQAIETLQSKLAIQAQAISAAQGLILETQAQNAKISEMLHSLAKVRSKPLQFVPDGLYRPTDWWDRNGIKWRQHHKIKRDDLWPWLYRINEEMGGQRIKCEVGGQRPAYYVEHRVLARHWKKLKEKYDRLQDEGLCFGPEDDAA